MKAILVGVNIRNDHDFNYSILELENLVKALDIKSLLTVKQNLNEPNDKYLLGKGKLLEIKNLIPEFNPDVIIEVPVTEQIGFEHKLLFNAITPLLVKS